MPFMEASKTEGIMPSANEEESKAVVLKSFSTGAHFLELHLCREPPEVIA